MGIFSIFGQTAAKSKSTDATMMNDKVNAFFAFICKHRDIKNNSIHLEKQRNRKKYIHKTCTSNYMQTNWHTDRKKKVASLLTQANFQLLKPPHKTEMRCKENLVSIENGPCILTSKATVSSMFVFF